ncbi:MAG: hypothetical protein LBC97_14340 [Bifidobacteriaceae bacterium]|nr:hypothetical protein [Bifidobacteriaceae bacterium]
MEEVIQRYRTAAQPAAGAGGGRTASGDAGSASDPQAVREFAALYRDHHARLVAYARRRLGGVDQAEDVAAEVFRIAWERTRRGLDPPPSAGWLFVTARNVLAHEWRAIGRATELSRRIALELDRSSGACARPPLRMGAGRGRARCGCPWRWGRRPWWQSAAPPSWPPANRPV